jgi:hypothetical protein
MSSKNHDPKKPRLGSIGVRVFDKGTNIAGEPVRRPVKEATIGLYRCPERSNWRPSQDLLEATARTDEAGYAEFESVPRGEYYVLYHHWPKLDPRHVTLGDCCSEEVCFDLKLGAKVTAQFFDAKCQPISCGGPRPGDHARISVDFQYSDDARDRGVRIQFPAASRYDYTSKSQLLAITQAGEIPMNVSLLLPSVVPELGEPVPEAALIAEDSATADPKDPEPPREVALTRGATVFTADVAFWRQIVNATEALSFNNYFQFMETLFCGDATSLPGTMRGALRKNFDRRRLPFSDTDAYRVVKAATEAFVMVNCGTVPPSFSDPRDAEYLKLRDIPPPAAGMQAAFGQRYLVGGVVPGAGILPYLAVIRKKLPDIDIKSTLIQSAEDNLDNRDLEACYGILQERLTSPCLLELIWSYWHEEGMLVQTMNALTRRFQNVRAPGAQDPLANLEIDPLRSLNNLLWGYIQDEQHRLTVLRRNYEYDHHYGLRLEGKAVQGLRPADSRSKFLEAFHNLFRLCVSLYRQDDDTTVKADAFPVLNALKEVHLILTEGQHNQFGDLPSTARIEMLMQQWFLARPEFREFLPTRISVAYPEPWMDRVDAMKKLQGWSDASVLHFRNLGVFGEQVLASIRWGHWSDVHEAVQALNWARHFRPQIQGYTHAYRATTSVELAIDGVDSKVDATLPSVLLSRRLATQKRSA